MVHPLAGAFDCEDWQTDLEVPIRMGETIGFVDLVAEREGYCIAVEAECSAARVERDLDKAQALRADELWIVTPTRRVADAVQRRLGRLLIPVDPDSICVLTQGQALHRVTSCLPLIAGR